MNAIKEELLRWTCKMHATNNYLDRRMLREKVLELTKLRGPAGFRCSERWLTNFLKEHGFSVDLASHTGPTFANYRDWINLMRATITKYKHHDLFHVDELTMYTDVLPARIGSEETMSSRDRVTVLMGCNSTGTIKLPLLIRGTYPSWITLKEHVYCSNNNSYENELLRNWLSNVNDRMLRSNRKILMFLRRNRAQELKGFALSNVKLVFLPEEFPPMLRPLRKDVFHYVKMIYRRRYAERLKQYTEEWSLRDTLSSLIEAWETIPREIIVSGFQKTHFRTDNCLLQIDYEQWDSLKADVSFKRFVTFDDKLSDEQVFCERNNHCYNLRASCRNLVQVNQDNAATVTEDGERSMKKYDVPRISKFDRNHRSSLKLTDNLDQNAIERSRNKHRDARGSSKRVPITEKGSRKRAHSEDRSFAKVRRSSKDRNVKDPFVSRDSKAIASRSLAGKAVKQEADQTRQIETNNTRESLHAIIDEALTLTTFMNADYAKKLIDRIHASIREINQQASNAKPSQNDEQMDLDSAKAMERAGEASTSSQLSKEANPLSEISQSVANETECSLASNKQSNLNDENDRTRQGTDERTSNDDESKDKNAKVDRDWSKQFETTFVFGPQNANCSSGVRQDDNIFNMKSSVSPRE